MSDVALGCWRCIRSGLRCSVSQFTSRFPLHFLFSHLNILPPQRAALRSERTQSNLEGGLCLRLMHHAQHYQIQPGSGSRLVAAQAASPCKLNTPLNAAPARALISSGDGSKNFLLRSTWLVILQRLVSCSNLLRGCVSPHLVLCI